MRAPDFLVIGAAKAATSSLCAQLAEHPDVFICEPKEPHYFTWHWDRSWEWYTSHFANAHHEKVVGEGSTSYSRIGEFPDVVERVATFLPDARILYIVRHPLERIQSHWAQSLHQNAHNLPFNQAVRNHLPLIDASLYWRQLNSYRAFYPDERILLLFFEDYKENANQVVRQCCEFLAVDPVYRTHASKSAPMLNPRSSLSMDNSLLRISRRLTPESFLARVPRPVKKIARKILRRPIPTADWERETLRWAIDKVALDSRQILKFAGKPQDFWRLENY